MPHRVLRQLSRQIKHAADSEPKGRRNVTGKWEASARLDRLAGVIALIVRKESVSADYRPKSIDEWIATCGLLITQRSSKLRNHAGTTAFPGGSVDASDGSILSAALRETWEEIGVPAERILVLGNSSEPMVAVQSGDRSVMVGPGALQPMAVPDAKGGMRVYPFLCIATREFSSKCPLFVNELNDADLDDLPIASISELNLVLCEDEVDRVFLFPLEDLMDPDQCKLESIEPWDKSMKFVTWYGPGGERIWGMTGHFFNEYLNSVFKPLKSML